MSRPTDPVRHLDPATIASYLDRALDPAEAAAAEAHLAGCPDCRAELVEVDRLLDARRRRPRRWIVGAALAAAALAGVLLLTPGEEVREADPVFRDAPASGADSVPRVEVLQPAAGATVPAEGPVFRWRAIEAGTTYRLTLTDGRGDVVWQAGTRDTFATVPPRAGLRAGEEYYWYVDALLSDGRSASSGVQRFRAGP